MFKILIGIIGGVAFAVLFVFSANAYGVETHGLLTKEVVSFYNTHFSNDISDKLGVYLIDGAMHEDTNPRYLNHFYDPVNDRGLDDGIYSGQGSKYWSRDEKSQTALVYKLFAYSADTILTASQLSKIDSIYYKTNFTWQKAIDLYAEGREEEALFAVGHVLHLIEDAAVPDHTRNDAHPPFDDGGSPYENWTKKFNLNNLDKDLPGRLSSKKPILLSDLNSYFDSMSNYSNNNFYSRDSIKNFNLPVIDYLKKIDGDRYGFKKDNEFGDYRLGLSNGSFIWSSSNIESIDRPVIFQDYWSRLSTKAVQHGAGVLDLFFREGEKAREKLARERVSRPYLATLMDGFGSLFSGKTVVVESLSTSEESKPTSDVKTTTSEETGQSTSDVGTGEETVNTPTSEESRPASDVKETVKLPTSEESEAAASDVNIPTSEESKPASDVFIVHGGSGDPGRNDDDSKGTDSTFEGSGPNTSTSEESEAATSDVNSDDVEEPTPMPTPEPTPTPTPSFLTSVDFYKSTKDEKYYLSLNWDEYPFVPVKFGHLVSGQPTGHNWHTLVFYYNQEAPLTDDLFWISNNPSQSYKNWGLTAPNGLKVKYPNCQNTETGGSALILPDTAGDCIGLAGNHASFAFDINKLEDNNLFLEIVDERIFSPSLEGPIPNEDYISIAYYGYQPGYEPNNYGLKFISADPEKYYFRTEAPVSQAPAKPENITFDFNETASRLKISWAGSTDPDTLDELLTYEISYGDGMASTSDRHLEISVQPAAIYSFEIKAVDDSGNKSEAAVASYTVPDLPLPYGLESIVWDESGVTVKFPAYPFMPADSPGAMIFFLNQEPPADWSFLNDDYRNGDNIGGTSTVLKLNYPVCDYGGTWRNPFGSAALFVNNADCPDTPLSILFSALSLAKLASSDVEFTAEVAGVVENKQPAEHQFSPDDYITVGFYELGPRDRHGNSYFRNTANYNGKIYFREN